MTKDEIWQTFGACSSSSDSKFCEILSSGNWKLDRKDHLRNKAFNGPKRERERVEFCRFLREKFN